MVNGAEKQIKRHNWDTTLMSRINVQVRIRVQFGRFSEIQITVQIGNAPNECDFYENIRNYFIGLEKEPKIPEIFQYKHNIFNTLIPRFLR